MGIENEKCTQSWMVTNRHHSQGGWRMLVKGFQIWGFEVSESWWDELWWSRPLLPDPGESPDCGCYRPAVTVSSWWIILARIDYQLAVNNNRSITNHSPRTAFVLSDWLLAPQRSLKSVTATFLAAAASLVTPLPLSLRLSPLSLCLQRHLSSPSRQLLSTSPGSHFLIFIITCIKIPGQPQWLREECPRVFRHGPGPWWHRIVYPHLVSGGSRGLATHRWRPCPGHNNSNWSEFSQSGR